MKAFAAEGHAAARRAGPGPGASQVDAMEEAPEFRVFCEALRRALAPGAAAPWDASLAESQWTRLLRGARRHRVAPLLLKGLSESGLRDAPPWVTARLTRLAEGAARRSLAQLAEVRDLAQAFAEAGIRAMALKGVVLSLQLARAPSQRVSRDIDLWVDPARADEAAAILARLGYAPDAPGLSPRQMLAHRHRIKDMGYQHAQRRIAVELHHRLYDNPHLLESDFEAAWAERDRVRVGAREVAALPRHLLPLYVCLHGAGHGWERLCWLVDFVATVPDAASVERALRDADAAGLAAPMLHALMLGHAWLGLAVDARHLARARADRDVRKLDRILAPLFAGAAWCEMPRRGSRAAMARYSLWQRLYRLMLRRSWRYRAAQAMREMISPTDWETVRLPDRLFWLYPAVRPVGWLIRRLKR